MGLGGESTAHHMMLLIPNRGELRVSGSLDQLEEWADGNLLKFNADKIPSPTRRMV